MYNVTFKNDNGKRFYFGTKGKNVFDMDLGNGVSVNIGTSQGFGQIGETLQTQSVGGRTINVKGSLFGNIPSGKHTLRSAIAPFSSGILIFQDKYYTRVYVKETPTFSSKKNDGKFSLQFYAPYPFFYSVDKKGASTGTVTPMFRFPVNYGTPHKFGERSTVRTADIINDGDVKVPFEVSIQTIGFSRDITITNIKTEQVLKINGSITAGEEIKIYRDKNNILRAELRNGAETTDIISRIDESSDFFELDAGENIVNAKAEEGGSSLVITLSFNSAVVNLYED